MEELELDDSFPDEQVLTTTLDLVPLYAYFVNFVFNDIIPDNLSIHQKKKFLHDMNRYFWDESYLFRDCVDKIIRKCIMEVEILSILEACHSSPVRGHHTSDHTARKILQSGYYWPSIHKDAYEFVKACDNVNNMGLSLDIISCQ